MAASFGKNVKVTVFGQSHSEAIGCVVDGIPAGLTLDVTAIEAHMKRRAPGRGNSLADSKTITARSETDQPHIVSGVLDGVDSRRVRDQLRYRRLQVQDPHRGRRQDA